MRGCRVEVEVAFVRNHQVVLGRESESGSWALPAIELQDSDVAPSALAHRLAAGLGLALSHEARLLGAVKEAPADVLLLRLMASVSGEPTSDSSAPSLRRPWAWFPLVDVPVLCRTRSQRTIAETCEQVVRDASTAFDSLYARLAGTPVLSDINRAVLGTDIDQYGFLSASEVDRILARANAAGDGPIVEIGAGLGGLACAMAKAGRSVVAIEPSPVALLNMRLRAQKQGIDVLSSHRGRAERFCDLDTGEQLSSQAFAVVVGADVSYFVAELDRFAGEAFRVLRPGGHLLLAAVCPRSANDVVDSLVCGPFMRPPDRIVRLLTEAGFGSVETEDWTSGYTEVIARYIEATRDRIDVLGDAIGGDTVGSWIHEFTAEQDLLEKGRMVRLLFAAEKGRNRD